MIGMSPFPWRTDLIMELSRGRPAPLPTNKPKWTGPPNIAIYLSTIELPDLKPKPKAGKSQAQSQPQAQPQPQPHVKTQPQSRPHVPQQSRPSPPQAAARPPVLSKPNPQPQQAQQPTRTDRPGGSIPNNAPVRPPPPQQATDGHEPRKPSFGRLLNNLVRQ
jgi:hypothetical protein